jgi:hypothetical protein
MGDPCCAGGSIVPIVLVVAGIGWLFTAAWSRLRARRQAATWKAVASSDDAGMMPDGKG